MSLFVKILLGCKDDCVPFGVWLGLSYFFISWINIWIILINSGSGSSPHMSAMMTIKISNRTISKRVALMAMSFYRSVRAD